MLKQKVDDLEQRIDQLLQENEKIKDYSKKLLMDDIDLDKITSTDVHSFYQDIFITDLQKKLLEKSEESSGLNKQIIETSNTLEKLQNENLKAK